MKIGFQVEDIFTKQNHCVLCGQHAEKDNCIKDFLKDHLSFSGKMGKECDKHPTCHMDYKTSISIYYNNYKRSLTFDGQKKNVGEENWKKMSCRDPHQSDISFTAGQILNTTEEEGKNMLEFMEYEQPITGTYRPERYACHVAAIVCAGYIANHALYIRRQM